MIEIIGVSKKFDDIVAVNEITLPIRENSVFGMIGTNGAGKSTVLRMMSGVLKQDSGEILIDGLEVYDNTKAKSRLFFIADEPYFFANANAAEMEAYYKSIYTKFDTEKFYRYLDQFGLEKRRKINTFSKGMKKQLALLLGICSNTKYLFCDETFDGLDPVMRQGVKAIFANEMEERGLTPIVASHNLRELEDICDHVGLLHKGGVLLAKDVEDMKYNIQKVQCVFATQEEEEKALKALQVIKDDRRGTLHTITVRGSREQVEQVLRQTETVFCEILPLSLEEIFISETEVIGYDIKKLIFG
ncbi:MAG: ABC transporter ATP-binding protein [Lachnospiraceae bacterium]|nr:ABC transporter ATP-binding protein [Lachnospiraceae bacterium]